MPADTSTTVSSPVAPRPSAGLLAALGVFVLAVALGGYAWRGSPGLRPVPAGTADAPDAQEQAARQQIEGMVDKLAQRLKDKPDDATGWLMLGRSYTVLGRIDDAIPAYERAVALRGDDATTLADYAEALANKSGGAPTAQSDAIVARALAAQPTNLKALAMAGSSSFQRGDYPGAVSSWEKMAQGLPPDSQDAPRLQASLAEARRRAGIAAPTGGVANARTAAGGSAATTAPASSTVAPGPGISGTVTLAPALAAQAAPTDTVFVFARAVQGPRMPLAVLRAQVKDLPITYRLDDTMAMTPNARISTAGQVIVGARISKSGNALAQPGDLAGESSAVAPGATGVAVTISGPTS